MKSDSIVNHHSLGCSLVTPGDPPAVVAAAAVWAFPDFSTVGGDGGGIKLHHQAGPGRTQSAHPWPTLSLSAFLLKAVPLLLPWCPSEGRRRASSAQRPLARKVQIG